MDLWHPQTLNTQGYLRLRRTTLHPFMEVQTHGSDGVTTEVREDLPCDKML